jgi:AcrR family transcriptional regulator
MSYHHGNLRRALLDAALVAIGEEGPEGFTLRDVARRAGVSPGAPYRHFSDKNALLAAVAAECAERLGQTMDRAVRAAGDDPLETYRATGIAYLRFAVENPCHFRAMNTGGISAHVPKETRRAVAEWKGRELERLGVAQRRGQISDLPLESIMLAARCLMHGLAHLIVDQHDGFSAVSPRRAEALARAVTEVFGRGLKPRLEGSSGPLAKGRGPRRRSRPAR